MNNQRVVYIRALTGCTDCPLVAFIGHSGTVYTLPEVLLVWEVHVTVRARSSPHSHLFLVSYTSTDAREWEHESCTGSTLQPELTEFSYTLHTYIHTSNTNAIQTQHTDCVSVYRTL